MTPPAERFHQAAQATDAKPTDGRTDWYVGEYRVELAVGGHPGVRMVYDARGVDGNRAMVVVLSRALSDDPDLCLKFEQLARVRSSLRHDSILPLLAAGTADGRLYIAIRWPEGARPLAHRLQDGAPDTGLSVRVLAQVASALEVGQAAGLVHRDLSSETILIDRQDMGRGLLTDFGIVAPERSGQLVALAGDSGTVSPEEARGEPPSVRSNVYRLACVLVECLTGAPPFDRGRPAARVSAHLTEDPPQLSKRNADLPEAIDDVVARALAKDPADRFPTPLALIQSVAEVLAVPLEVPGAPAPSTTPSPPQLGTTEHKLPRRGVRGARSALRAAAALRVARPWKGAAHGLARRPRRAHRAPKALVAAAVAVPVLAAAAGGFAAGHRSERAAAPTGPTTAEALLAGARQDAGRYLTRAHATMARLDRRRAHARRTLAAARTPHGQAGQAEGIAGAYRDAARELAAARRGAPAGRRLERSLRAAARAYDSLAAAVRRADRPGYRAAQAEIARREDAVRRAARDPSAP